MKKPKLAYKKNLQDQLNMPYPRPIAVCPACGAEYSANKGDYWQLEDDDALTCCNGLICELYVKKTVYEAA